MRVVHLGYADDLPGASRASLRLHRTLVEHGIDSHMVVALALVDDERIHGPATRADVVRARLAGRVDAAATRLLTVGAPERTLALVGSGRVRAVGRLDPDVVQLHWLGGGLVRPAGLRALPDVPLVWRLPDEWPLRGTPHYASPPRRITDRTVERWAEHRKRRAYDRLREVTVVAPSAWLGREARESSTLGSRTVEVIPTGVDLETWSPGDRAESAAALGLPVDRPIVLFGATGGGRNPRKGWDLLLAGLRRLDDDVVLAAFGGGGHVPDDLRARTVDLGRIDDQRNLLAAYRAADAFVAPSRQENLPNTGLEALAAGTPVIGFAIGGMPDLVEHGRSGWLAPAFDAAALAEGISWAIAHPEARAAARQRAEQRFDRHAQAAAYEALYRSLS